MFLRGLKIVADYLWNERHALIFSWGLALLFVGLIQLELFLEYAKGLVTCFIALATIFVSGLMRRF